MKPISRKTTWIIWIAIFIPYMYVANVVMPNIQRDIKAIADKPECAKALDIMMFGISMDAAEKSLTCMGEEGRMVYRSAEKLQDSIYPALYTLFFVFTLFSLGSYVFGGKKFYVYLLLIPFLGMAFDFYENHLIVNFIDQFPELSNSTIWSLSLANSIKWLLAFSNILMVLVFAVLSLIKVIKNR